MTRRLLIALLGLALCAAGSGSQTAPAAVVAREVVLDAGSLRIRDEGALHRIDLAGGGAGITPGAADLPTLPVTVLLPPGTRAERARVDVLETQRFSGPFRPRLVDGAASTPAPEPDAEGFLPREQVLRVRTGSLRGQRLATVLLAPVSWNPADGSLRLATRFRVTVEAVDAPPEPGDFVLERESPQGRRNFEEVLRRLGGDDPARFRPSAHPLTLPSGPFAPGFRPTVDGSPVEMVILTTADQEAEYQRLADYRTKTGLATVVRTVDWVKANYPQGADLAETLRNFLEEAAAKWGTVYVLLGGDTGRIPTRHVVSEGFADEPLTTDLYYSDLDRNWNADGDDRFGEGDSYLDPRDTVDLYPDLWVGRLPSNNAAEAKILVDKTLAYSINPPLGYQKDVLLPAEVLFPDRWQPGQPVQFDGAVLAEAVADTLPPGLRKVRMYENHLAWPGSLPEAKAAVIDSVNAGFHLVHFVGHGFINTISVGLGFQTLGNADAGSFTNGAEQFLLVTMDCTSSAIDYNCIAERFMLNPNGGAMASIGATEIEYPTTAYLYQQEFYHLLFPGGVTDLGRTLGASKIPFVIYADEDNPHRWTQMSFILLADPSLVFWTDVPRPLAVTHDPVFELGAGAYPVSVLRDGQPLAGARVTLWKDGDEYAVGTTDAQGQVSVPFQPDLTGSFSVAVTASNSLTYLGSATAAPSTTAYLFAESQTVLDVPTAPTNGNGDGRIDAGERVEVRFTVRNNGCATASGILGSLVSSDPYVTVIDGTGGVPNLAPGASALMSDRMLLQIARSAPDRHEAHATLTFAATGGPFVEDVVFRIHAPVVEYWRQSVRDSLGSGNGDGVIAAGEGVAILPVIRNAGQGALRNASVRLRSLDPAVVLLDTTATLGTVAPGATAGNPADGLALRFTNLTSVHPVTVTVRDAYGDVFSRRIDFQAPAAVSAPGARGSAAGISLTWTPAPDADLWGYAIARSNSPSGPFARVNPWTVLRTSAFDDDGLPPLTRFYYKVAAVDSSGNPGPWSPVASAATTLQLREGWPADAGAAVPAGVIVADLDGNGTREVLGGGSEILVFTPDGEDYVDGDVDAQTRGPITDTGGTEFWNTPAAADVDGDGDLEIASVGWGDALLHLVDVQGHPLPGWPKNANPLGIAAPSPVGSVTMADVDADGDMEIFATVGRAILGWHHDGTEIADGDANPATSGVLAVTGSPYCYGTPSVADVDGEPFREIVAGMRDGKLYVLEHDGTPHPGFPFAAGGDITSGPSLGDIDLDGAVEMVFGSSNGKVWALRADLSVATGFPVSMPLAEDWDSSPALGDLTGDGAPDVVIADSGGMLHVLSGVNGAEPPGFPASLSVGGVSTSSRSGPVLVDLDHDGSLDILVGDRNGWLHAFDAQGASLPGFPIQTGNRIEASPAVADLDGDGLSEVVVQSQDQHVYVWNTPWIFDPSRAPWPMMKGNPAHTGSLGDADPGAPVGVPETPALPLLLAAGPNPFRGAATLRFRVPEGTGPVPVSLAVYDLAGRRVRTLVAGDRPGGVHDVTWNAVDDAGRRVGAGVYLYRLRVASREIGGKLVLLP